MAISSSASGLRPGVCTSTTRPTNPYTGQIIYETDTGYLRVWDGAAWDYLSQKQDTAESLPPETYMGLVKVIPTSISSAGGTAATLNSATGTVTIGSGNTSVTVTCFSSLYDNYKVTLNQTGASVETFLKLQFGSATTQYYGTQAYDLYNAGDTGYARTNNGDALRVAPLGVSTGRTLVSIDIFQPFLTLYTMFSGSNYGNGYTGYSGGEHFSSTSHTSFKLSLGSGSFNGGTIRVYGYRN